MNTVHINVFLTISESLKVIKCSGIVSCYSFGWGTVHGVFQLIYEFNDLSMWHSKTWSKWQKVCNKKSWCLMLFLTCDLPSMYLQNWRIYKTLNNSVDLG